MSYKYNIQRINEDGRIADSVDITREDFENILDLFADAYYSDKANYNLQDLERKFHSIRHRIKAA
jgi:hypothetical protein